MTPIGASVQKLGIEVGAGESESRFALIKTLGANVTEPNFVGLYENGQSIDDDNPFPIAHFAGFNNLANFVQPYQVQISRLDSVDTIGAKTNKDGTGFDRAEDNVNKIEKKNEMTKAKDAGELFTELVP
jgi:hypothetical protein